MGPVVHFIRHAQGQHNLGLEFCRQVDPELTPLGRQQCEDLRCKYFPNQSRIALVVASPLSRTLQTALFTFPQALRHGGCRPEILALPDAQEVVDFPCNTGSELSTLETKCRASKWPVDLSLVQDGWTTKAPGSRYFPASEPLKRRARDCRRLLRQLARDLMQEGTESPEIAVVTHGGFLHFLTEDWEDSAKFSGTGWHNAEARTYAFEDMTDGDAHLVETSESRQRRGKVHPMYARDKQQELFRLEMQRLEDLGMENPLKLDAMCTPAP